MMTSDVKEYKDNLDVEEVLAVISNLIKPYCW